MLGDVVRLYGADVELESSVFARESGLRVQTRQSQTLGWKRRRGRRDLHIAAVQCRIFTVGRGQLRLS